MGEDKLKQLADDVHLITKPFRVVTEWIKILLFLAVVAGLCAFSVIHWIFTGKGILHGDDLWFVKVLGTVLSPWITTFAYIFYTHWREVRGHTYRRPVPSFVVFFGTLVIVLILVKCNFYYGWGFYRLH
jgi:hypothetical protein